MLQARLALMVHCLLFWPACFPDPPVFLTCLLSCLACFPALPAFLPCLLPPAGTFPFEASRAAAYCQASLRGARRIPVRVSLVACSLWRCPRLPKRGMASGRSTAQARAAPRRGDTRVVSGFGTTRLGRWRSGSWRSLLRCSCAVGDGCAPSCCEMTRAGRAVIRAASMSAAAPRSGTSMWQRVPARDHPRPTCQQRAMAARLRLRRWLHCPRLRSLVCLQWSRGSARWRRAASFSIGAQRCVAWFECGL